MTNYIPMFGWPVAALVSLIFALFYARLREYTGNTVREMAQLLAQRNETIANLRAQLDQYKLARRRPNRDTDAYERLDTLRLRVEKLIAQQTEQLNHSIKYVYRVEAALVATEKLPEAEYSAIRDELEDTLKRMRENMQQTTESYLAMVCGYSKPQLPTT